MWTVPPEDETQLRPCYLFSSDKTEAGKASSTATESDQLEAAATNPMSQK